MFQLRAYCATSVAWLVICLCFVYMALTWPGSAGHCVLFASNAIAAGVFTCLLLRDVFRLRKEAANNPT